MAGVKGRSGRRPKANALRIADGASCRHAEGKAAPNVPRFPDGEIERPYKLSEGADRVWQRVLPALAAAGVMKPAYATQFANYCEMQARFEADPGAAKPSFVTQLRAYSAMFRLDPSGSGANAFTPEPLRLCAAPNSWDEFTRRYER